MIRLFLDTDIGPDCDDAGAVQVLHTLADRGQVQLLGMTHCTGSPYGLPALSAINRVNGREIPLGTSSRQDFLNTPQSQRYTRYLAEHFDHAYRAGEPQRHALEVMREVLCREADGSVTFAAIGPMNNLAEALADAETRELIRKKVRLLVAMAGRFDCDRPEWNIEMDIPSAQKVMREWPSPVVLCGWECGSEVLTGERLTEKPLHPVFHAYRIYTQEGMRRPSWDLLTVLYAVEGDSERMQASPAGRIDVDAQGVTRFTETPDGQHRYVLCRRKPEELACCLNALM